MSAETLCFERLQVIQDDVPRSAALNMALDEVLLNGPIDAPLLRFYRWAQPAVSCGYFEVAEAARRVAQSRELVRRPTGGGIVEHGDDVTFTLIVPRTDTFSHLRSAESYRRIHTALARALTSDGFVSQTHNDSPPLTVAGQSNACFKRPVRHDLMADGKKVAGGAQRRNRLGLLHQGSVLLDMAAGDEWKDHLRRVFPLALARFCEKRILTTYENARAESLAAEKYAAPGWTDRV